MKIDIEAFKKPCACGHKHDVVVEDIIIEKGAVVGGGSDVTDDLITKMGKASDDQIKEVENAAKAQEQQDAQQNAQQADQATTSTTEAAQ